MSADDLLDRVPLWDSEATRHEEKARALRQLIEAVRVLNGDAARLFAIEVRDTPTVGDAPTLGTPRGRAAIRLVIAERPGKWTTSDIKRELKLRGWPATSNAVDTALQRMKDTGEAVRVAKGVYRFGTTELEPSAPVTGDGS